MKMADLGPNATAREIQVAMIQQDYEASTPLSVEAAGAKQQRLMDAVPHLLAYIDELRAEVERLEEKVADQF